MSDILGMFPKGFMGGVGKLIAAGGLAVAGAWVTGKAIKLMLSTLLPGTAVLGEIAASTTTTAAATTKMAAQLMLPGMSAPGTPAAPQAAATTLRARNMAQMGPYMKGGLLAAGTIGAGAALHSIATEKDKEKRGKKMTGAALGAIVGGVGGFLVGGPLGAYAGAGIGAKAGEWGAAQMATGGIVTKPTLSMTGEKGPEAVVPLNAQGREGIGMTDNNKLLEANNNKLDELIAAVKSQPPVLFKSDLEKAGFMNKFTKVI
jgi:hypothetical protein